MKYLDNWKTTLPGVIAILGVVSKWAVDGNVNPNDFNILWNDVLIVLTGVGLIAARDAK